MFLSKEQYRHAYDMARGRERADGLLAEMRAWVKETWDAELLDLFYDTAGLGRKRLYAVMAAREDVDRVEKDPVRNARLEFSDKFRALCESYPRETDWREGDEFFVAFNSFADEVKPEVLSRASKELEALANDREFSRRGLVMVHPAFSDVHFFYETDRQIQENERKGISGKLCARCGKIVEKYDELGLFRSGVPCVFTSKQTLDEKFKGSLFYYMR